MGVNGGRERLKKTSSLSDAISAETPELRKLTLKELPIFKIVRSRTRKTVPSFPFLSLADLWWIPSRGFLKNANPIPVNVNRMTSWFGILIVSHLTSAALMWKKAPIDEHFFRIFLKDLWPEPRMSIAKFWQKFDCEILPKELLRNKILSFAHVWPER